MFFKTDNLSLAPYLFLQNLKYTGTESGIGKGNKSKVFFVFEDPKGVGKELERSFLNSVERRYKEAQSYFRNQIKLHLTSRSYNQ